LATVFADNARRATVLADFGAFLTSSCSPNSVAAPTGSRTGSGKPTVNAPLSEAEPGPITCSQASDLSGQPSSAASDSATARTAGELAIDVPVTAVFHAPASCPRRNDSVDSGTHTSGRSVPSETATDSATSADSRLDTRTR
jgi:hypothetical protein